MITTFACEAEDREAFLNAMLDVAPFGEIPTHMIGWFQDEPVEQPKDWIRQSVRATETVFVRWESLERSVIVINARDEKILKVQTQRAHLDKAFFLRLVATESVRVLVASWESFQDAARLMGHMTHLGWGCFFKGAGHDHFASPRWLEHGPWLLERHGDVTYVQLYDLALEGDAAWQQGQHAMVRLSEGFFSKFGYTEVQTFGSYDLPSRSFTIVRTDQGVSQMDLWDYCLVRAMCRDDEAEPIEHIRVVFTEERDARRHLHELWLRGIECWALLADGRRVRLDLDYQPPARILPEWVEQHLGLPPSGPYAAAVPLSGPAPAPATGTRSSGVRLSLGLSSLLGPLTTEERRQLLAALVRYRPKVGLRDVPARADGADASAAFAGLVDEGEPWNADLPLAATQAALEATEFVVDVFLPLELIGLSVPSILVPHEFPSQAPLRATDLGAAALGAKLAGAVVLPVDDVLARVCALNRQDLRCAEQLLTLCGKHRLIVVARSPANG